ncbi:hypothetical protein [Methylomicrobium sp. Wu6]|uniref:hypothetical protein n=1 Tax=Methylomicrobium sp. Wu6 TaxID=3107928 RepID=UPI002DD6457E|nr:hypothetical protein [Methylomicrobium sp. Wu6]MEC4747829.1 hypothetical protein [Methylomicrobium sp. Wu6]
MSNEEKAKQSLDTAKNLIGNLTSSALALKESNPKVFYGAVGGVALLLLLVIFTGGEKRPTVEQYTKKSLAVGQTYSLKSPNSYDPASTIRLVPAPGTLAAYDDTEEADRTGTCQHFPQGTSVKVLRLQDAFDTANSFAEVSIEGGECNGKTGWVLAIDLQ